MKEFSPAKKREVSVGESVRILRELQELSQSRLFGLKNWIGCILQWRKRC